ncbi:MAG: TonB-dependent receptor, partial [Bacteroidota bacterium]
WYVGSTGDGSFVPMNSEKRTTIQTKLTIPSFGSDKLRLSYLNQARDFRNYDHRYKYNPDGAYKNFVRGDLAGLNYNGVIASTTFWEFHGAWFSNREQSYAFEDPYDPRFPPYTRALETSGPAFLAGGAEDLHFHRESRYWLSKVDLVSQVNNEHQIKVGIEGKWHRIWVHNFGIHNDQTTNFKPQPIETGRSEFADVIIQPTQYSGYIQDKMEFKDFIVNLGVRFDFFDPKADILTAPLKLGNPLSVAPSESESQLSPRFGLAFPITDRGVLHLSYGHFFQIPQFDLIYLNPSYNMNATEAFQVGNPGLKSERTVAYEFGLQQQLGDVIGLDVTAYYKDFRNLIGTRIYDIGNGNKYSQYVNQDYGNARGIIVSLERRSSDGFAATIDYTFQIVRGNASDPNSVFLDNVTDPPRESQKQLAPLDWDRRHSLNISATIGNATDYTVTLIGRLGTGLPYTPAFQNQRTGLLNSESRPLNYNLDLYATKYLDVFGSVVNVFVKVYNVFDTRNELDVFTDTGRADYSLEANYSGNPRGINTIQEYYMRPDYYSAPRQMIVGAEISF